MITNPLISERNADTLNNASEALHAFMLLLSDQHNGLCLLLHPIVQAISHVADTQDA